jgi:hypothetical protein
MLVLLRRSQVFLAFVLGALGCAEPPRRALPPVVALPSVAHVDAQPKRALATGCRATPSTVYGDEPVAFDIEGPSDAAPVEVELLDQARRALVWETVPVPGAWRPADVPSGDFMLQVGSNHVSCQVTVNRELSRGRAAEQK